MFLLFACLKEISRKQNTFFVFSDCRITKENQNFLILSEKQTDANTAIKTCSSSGGKLAEVTSQTASNKTKLFLKENLISNGEKDCVVTVN